MVTWASATDWDSAQSESGVVHESVTNTDHTDDTVVKQGYSIASPSPASASLRAFWPLHEDSGTTGYDKSGNGYDMTSNNGAGPSGTGTDPAPLGVTGWDFDGSDDYAEASGAVQGGGESVWTITYWMKIKGSSYGVGRGCVSYDGATGGFYTRHDDDGGVFYSINSGGSGNNVSFTDSLDVGNWHFWAFVWDGNNSYAAIYKDATVQAEDTSFPRSNMSDSGRGTRIASYTRGGGASQVITAAFADVRCYEAALSSTDVQNMYDVVNTSGTLTTAGKTL